MKRLLMIAYHFPPLAGSSGIQRTLRFVQHLPKFGWEPIVLSADPRAYERTSDDLLADVPKNTVVRRAFALDTARHLSIAGRYVGAMARPDRWVSWKYAAVRDGMRLIREFKPQAIWSTYPIATAHMIGAELQRRSGLPWIADFRDPMAQEGYPADPLTWKSYKAIEADTVHNASLSTFTTPGAARIYRERYPAREQQVVVLENGYDEETFVGAASSAQARSSLNPGAITLLHSGIVYPAERDPTQFFEALGQLKAKGDLAPGSLVVRFRASVHDDLLKSLAARFDIAEFIDCQPPVPYREALAEMLAADGLLVMQAANCNEQIPAKIYEYLRANRPILSLTDPQGDTATTLRQAGASDIARLDSVEEICRVLPAFIAAIREGRAQLPDRQAVADASREGRTAQLARLLDSVLGQ
ncbi:MAG: glycosyltransferase family 4 protein [Dechloromonas sp.]|nr:MAG: glycosyltransferase family 4 protein [Dechloromonas sp.]